MSFGESVDQKIRAEHLKRVAFLYVRQSSLRQVCEHRESTKRQYALRDRAVALGWPLEQVVVIDNDLGQSGASAQGREGFQRLVSEVGMGRAGIVMGLEVSRLARNSADWHRLLEICALTDTLILDEDGIYDPAHFNDRLLLGLKGTMSEAELHMIRARLIGGLLNKARRGELRSALPVGFAYDPGDRVVLEPDKQVQESIRTFFRTYHRAGSACGVVKEFREQGLLFPRKIRSGPRKDEIGWAPLEHERALYILHHPRYAGAFVWGRTRHRKLPDHGTRHRKLPREEWISLIPNAHPGYITWGEYEENQRKLRENARSYSDDRRQSPPREGPALLQGLVICGRCGRRMTVRYHTFRGQRYPEYRCDRPRRSEPACQTIQGRQIDKCVGDLLVEAVTPMTLEVALSVKQELQARIEEADRLRMLNVERARHEAELARRRYVRVDPDNRLVADHLEAEWNQKLRALRQAQDEYERQRQADRGVITDEQRAHIMALATDFPRLWKDPNTPHRERKRMVRLIIEDVTLIRAEQITIQLRFKGGATSSLTLPRPKPAWELRMTSPKVVAEIDHLLDSHIDSEIAAILNEKELRTGTGKLFDRLAVRYVRRHYGLKNRYDRLRETGMLTLDEAASRLGVCKETVKKRSRSGVVLGHLYNCKGQRLYEPPGSDPPAPRSWKGVSKTLNSREPVTNRIDEV